MFRNFKKCTDLLGKPVKLLEILVDRYVSVFLLLKFVVHRSQPIPLRQMKLKAVPLHTNQQDQTFCFGLYLIFLRERDKKRSPIRLPIHIKRAAESPKYDHLLLSWSSEIKNRVVMTKRVKDCMARDQSQQWIKEKPKSEPPTSKHSSAWNNSAPSYKPRYLMCLRHIHATPLVPTSIQSRCFNGWTGQPRPEEGVEIENQRSSKVVDCNHVRRLRKEFGLKAQFP